jgi:glycolate oxidase FAD binding subunit
MTTGVRPARVDLVISTQRLGRILDYSPEDMTITVEAGVTLAQAQNLMAGHGQMLPVDPPLPGRATLGGILAANASGPLRYQFGMPRDLCLGTVVVYPDGTVAKAGGRTVKNVAGYDMSRLHIGALGTLGLIVEATFKVAPVAKKLVTVSGVFPTLAAATDGARALRMARIVPWSLALVAPDAVPGLGDGYRVAVRLGGQPAVVDPQSQRAVETLKQSRASAVGEVDRAEEAFWPALRDWPATTGDGQSVVLRLGAAPSQTPKAVGMMQDLAASHALTASILAYPGAATIYCRLDGPADGTVDTVAGLLAAVKEWCANLVVERCPLALKDRLPIWGGATADALTRAVKQAYDPKSVLNPGRYIAGL